MRKAQNQTYDHSKPLSHMFTLFREFKDMSAAFGTFETDEHLINMATTILLKAKIFHLDFRFWNKMPDNEKTWNNFQLHFTEAQSELKLSNPDLSLDTPSTLGYTDPRINVVESFLQDLNSAPPAYASPDPTAYLPSPVPPAATLPPPIHQANVAPTDPTQVRMLELLSKLEAKIDNRNSTSTHVTSNNNNNGNRKPKKARNIQKYCWTHGACSHHGNECNKPADGHKKEATFITMMGGSTKNCFWITPSTTNA